MMEHTDRDRQTDTRQFHALLHILCEQYQYLSAERTLLPRFDVTDKDNSSCNDNRVHIV